MKLRDCFESIRQALFGDHPETATSMERVDLIGALTAQAIFLLTILIFAVRLLGHLEWGRSIGMVLLLTAVPLVYLLVQGPRYHRAGLYYLQVSLMLSFLLCEFLLDYLLEIDFRNVRWMLVSYVTLFFAGTGGMIGVAGQAGRFWSVLSVILFVLMGGLAFYQRVKTGV